jgi:hypothetical protein
VSVDTMRGMKMNAFGTLPLPPARFGLASWFGAKAVPVRDPADGMVVAATVFSNYVEEVLAEVGTDGVLDGDRLLPPSTTISAFAPDERPRWHLVRDGERAFLFPIRIPTIDRE